MIVFRKCRLARSSTVASCERRTWKVASNTRAGVVRIATLRLSSPRIMKPDLAEPRSDFARNQDQSLRYPHITRGLEVGCDFFQAKFSQSRRSLQVRGLPLFRFRSGTQGLSLPAWSAASSKVARGVCSNLKLSWWNDWLGVDSSMN